LFAFVSYHCRRHFRHYGSSQSYSKSHDTSWSLCVGISCKTLPFSKILVESFARFELDIIGQAVAPATVLMQTQVGRLRGLPGHQSPRTGSIPRAQLISSRIAKSAAPRGRQHCRSVYSSATSTKEPSLEVPAASAAFLMHLVPARGFQRRCMVLCGCQRCCWYCLRETGLKLKATMLFRHLVCQST